jgi:hypothetical protein
MAIGDGSTPSGSGRADVMFCGGTEAPITRVGVAGFTAMRALSRRNDEPKAASRPFDSGRDGFVMGEASGMLVLEELEHARARGAKIYAEVLGYGVSSDASHVSDPDPTGANPARAMRMAFTDAGIQPDEVGYVNAHGTSTPSGDAAETRVLKLALGEEKAYGTPVSSTKGATGHCLGAAGAIEAIFCTFALRDGVLPRRSTTRTRPRVRPRLHPERGAATGHRGRGQQLVRLRRPQRMRRVPPLGRRGLALQPQLEEDGVAPDAVELCDPLEASDEPEPEAFVERNACPVFSGTCPRGSSRSCALRAREGGFHQRSTDPATSRALRDVDRARRDPGVAPPRRRRSERDPAHDSPSSTATNRCSREWLASNDS